MGLDVCAHENWDNRLLMATQMKILQIKRIVMHLLDA